VDGGWAATGLTKVHEGTLMDAPTIARATLATIYLRLAPADIALVKFLFESYEEVGIVRTIDRHAAVIVVLVVPDFAATARAILDDLRRQIDVTEVPPLVTEADDWLMRDIDPDAP